MNKIAEIANAKNHYDGSTLLERMNECHTSAVSIALIEVDQRGTAAVRQATRLYARAFALFPRRACGSPSSTR